MCISVTAEISIPTLVAVGCISCVVLVLVLALCGGCTPMEVGSDQHEAAGGNRSYMESPYYTMGTNNVNSRVLTSGTSVANDPYQPEDNAALPYPVRPQTDNNFAGYQPQGYQQQHGYQQGFQQQQGYQQGYQQQQGYQSQQSHQQQHGYQQQASIPGANRHVMDESEPPPPSYNEALNSAGNQQNATAPSYGW